MRHILTLALLVFSLAACALPALAQAPAAVEAHTNGSRQIEVTWSAVANADFYNVYAGTTQGGPYTLQSGNPTTQTHKYVNTTSDATVTYVVVTAVVNKTESGYSPEASCASGSAQLAAPQNVTATATGGQVALTWSAVPGAASYDLYRTPTDPSSDSGIYLIQVTGTGYTDAKLTNGTTYTYQVAGVTTTGTGNLSGPVRATPLAPPSLTAIVEATANQSGTEIDLAWTASAGATSYVLYRGTSSGAEVAYPPATSATTFSDTNLSTNTTYYYQVKAIAQNGQSAKSAEVSATTGATLLPAPTLTTTARDAQVVLTWTTVSGAAYYDLYRLPNTDKSGLYLRIQGGDTSSHTDKAVTDGTTYTYWIAAGAVNGQGTPSNQVTATPIAQTTLTGTPVSSSEIDLSWTASAGATGYHIDRNLISDGGAWTTLTDVTGTSYADTGLTAGTDYYYRVTADNDTGASGPSNVVLAETFPPAVRLTALPGRAQVVLSWRAPAGNVGGYNLYRGTNSGGEGSSAYVTGVTTTRYTDTGVTNGTAYYYQLTAVNEGGESAKSNEASATPVSSAPTVAAAASASPNPVTGTTTNLWVLGASSGGESSLTYLWSSTGPTGVTYSDNGDNTAKNAVATFTQLGTYVFTATITDTSGDTATSSVTVTVSPGVSQLSLSPPSATVATGGTQAFTPSALDQFGNANTTGPLTWSVPRGGGSVDGSGVYTAPAGPGSATVQVASGGLSATARVTITASFPSAPTGLTATPGNAQVSLAWTAPAGAGLTSNVYQGVSAGGEGATPIATGVTGTSYIATGLKNGETYYYVVTAVNSAGESAPSNEASTRPPYAPPTVATAASAAPNPVTDRTTTLTVLGASAGGESNLTYTWTEALSDGTPIRANVTPNGTNPAKTATAYFTQPGSYVFTVTIRDLNGGSATSMVTVMVYSAVSSIVVTPDPASLAIDGTQPFTATVLDQFGTTIAGVTVAWSEDNATCSIDPVSGVLTAGADVGTATVTATDGDVTGTASVTVSPPDGPVVVTAASASPNPVTGTTTTLSVQATDGLIDDSTLTYTWAAMGTPPAPIEFSDNGDNTAQMTTVTFGQAGTYNFLVTITDSLGLTALSTVTVVVNQTPSQVSVCPNQIAIAVNTSLIFAATLFDQFGNSIDDSSFTWATSGNGTIDSTGLYTAPQTPETDTVTAVYGGLNGTASVTVTAASDGPVVATAASASPSPVIGTTTTLLVLGSDALGESTLTYTWTLTGTPPAPVTFGDNGTNTAKNAEVMFSQAGTYVFEVTITDSLGLSTASSVTVTVNQTATYITVLPIHTWLTSGETQLFTASELDQFGNAMQTQPAGFSWSVVTGSGTVDNQTGLYTAPNANETDFVQASDSGATGVAEITAGTGITVPAVPASAAPTILSAVAGNKQVTLTWSDTDASITSYNIYRGDSSSGGESPTPVTSVGGGSSASVTLTDTGLTNDYTYYYFVTAVNVGGESAISNEVTAIPVNQPPVIVGSISASPAYVTGTTVTLSVTATDDTPVSDLTYTWYSNGPAPVTFPSNGTTGADMVTVTFTEAGAYIFTVLVADPDGGTTTGTVTVYVAPTLTAVSVVPSSPISLTANQTYFFQSSATDQFGNPLSTAGAVWTVTSGSGTITAWSTPSGALYRAPNLTSPETDTITMTDGNLAKTVSVSIDPVFSGGHWGTYYEPDVQYRPTVSVSGTSTETFESGMMEMLPWITRSDQSAEIEPYADGSIAILFNSTNGYKGSVSTLGTVTFTFFWVPDAANTPPPSTSLFSVWARAAGTYAAQLGTATASDGLGDPGPEIDSYDPDGSFAGGIATSQGTHLMRINGSSGTATITIPSMSSMASGSVDIASHEGIAEVDANAQSGLPSIVSMRVQTVSPYSGDIVQAGGDVTISVHADITATGGTTTFPLESISVSIQGSSGGNYPNLPFDSNGDVSVTLTDPTPGEYTVTVQAMYSDGSTTGGTIEVDSVPSTFIVGSLSVQTGSWSPNPGYCGEPITGQVQAAFDPKTIPNFPYFVTYSWTTGGVWYSEDGTPGTFEPYTGNWSVAWTQGQASTEFSAVFNDIGYYILEVQCVATVYSVYDGAPVITFTQTGYIGGDASDIDTSGGTGTSQTPNTIMLPNIGILVSQDFSIMRNGKAIASYPAPKHGFPTQVVMVGQKITLTLSASPAIYSIASAVWTINGTTVANYVQQPTQAVATMLTTDDKSMKPSIMFYWIAPSGSKPYTVTFMIMNRQGVQVSASAQFQVNAPTLMSYTGTITKMKPPVGLRNNYNGAYGLSFGGEDGKGKPFYGIGFTIVTSIPDGGNGRVQWVQTVNTNRTITYVDKNTLLDHYINPIRNGKPVTALDAPSGEIDFGSGTASSATSETDMNGDAPSEGLFVEYQSVSAMDSFITYFMYQPDADQDGASIWVTVGSLSWSWNGSTMEGLLPIGGILLPYFYMLSSAPSAGAAPIAGVATSALPEWVTNITIIRDNPIHQ